VARNFSLHHRFLTGSGATQPPIQWVPGALSLGVKWLVGEAASRIRGDIPPLPNTPSWPGAQLKHRDNFALTTTTTTIIIIIIIVIIIYSLILREEHGLMAFQIKELRRIFRHKREKATRGWRKLHNEELHTLFSSSVLYGHVCLVPYCIVQDIL
jgi:hypothetical protein